MNRGESYLECETLRLRMNSSEERGDLRRAAQRIRWLPGVVAVEDSGDELEVVFRAPAEGLLRQIHQTLAAG